MFPKVIFSEFSRPVWVEVVRRLKKEYGWQPCYWIANPKVSETIKSQFPDTIYHSSFDAIRGIPAGQCRHIKQFPLDENIISALSKYETVVFHMMDRMDPGYAFSYQERVRLYYRQLRYWFSILKHYRPDIVVFPSSPHAVYDYVLYILCKELNVTTIILWRTVEGFMCPIERFEDELKSLVSLYKRLLSEGKYSREYFLPPEIQNYWDRISGDYSQARPECIAQYLKKPKFNFTGIIALSLRKVKSVFKYIKFIYQPALPNYVKQRGRRFEDSEMTYFEFLKLCKFAGDKKRRRIRVYYNKLAEEVDINKPYIYVALHAQPEGSTCPDGGIFVDQLLMIDLISKSLPEGWSIYAKEHIVQFTNRISGERSKTVDFYRDLASLPNVKLVPLSMSPFDLIDNAKAVVTVTGTTGWQAVARGKPVLTFGYSWYRGCEGVFYTPTKESCWEALSKIEKGYKVNRQKVKVFLKALSEVCFKGYYYIKDIKKAGASCEENTAVIAKAMQDAYEEAVKH